MKNPELEEFQQMVLQVAPFLKLDEYEWRTAYVRVNTRLVTFQQGTVDASGLTPPEREDLSHFFLQTEIMNVALRHNHLMDKFNSLCTKDEVHMIGNAWVMGRCVYCNRHWNEK